MKAVVLCGGLGTRLRPITYEIPKVLLPVKGKPVLEHILDLLKREEIEEVVLSVGYLKERIKSHFSDGGRFGIKISYLEEDSPLGTAGPLKMLGPQKEPVVVSNGDELKDIPVRKMAEFHRKSGASATIALTRVENPTVYGVANLEGSKILEFIEKPLNPPTNLINAGFYILGPEALELIPEGFSMLEKDLFPLLARQGRLFGFPFEGQWFDTGNLERWELAIKSWKGIKWGDKTNFSGKDNI
jgi:NDP-sugar pyrophosphorylase family protein